MERKFRIGFAVFWTLLIPVVCLINFSNIKEVQSVKIPNIDKFVHFCLYATFTFLWMWSLVKRNSKKSFLKYAFIIFVIATFFGISIEVAQENFTLTRSAEILDVFSNCLGALSGIIISKLILK